QIINIFNLEEITSYIYLIPIIIIFAGLMQISEQWLIRIKEFSVNAKATFYQSLLINSGKTIFGFIYPHANILVILTSMNNGVRALLMSIFLKKDRPLKKSVSQVRRSSKMKKIAKEYINFPLYRAPETFLNAVSQGLPVMILSIFFGPTSAGFYTIGKTTL